jgi:hypothetical protein
MEAVRRFKHWFRHEWYRFTDYPYNRYSRVEHHRCAYPNCEAQSLYDDGFRFGHTPR